MNIYRTAIHAFQSVFMKINKIRHFHRHLNIHEKCNARNDSSGLLFVVSFFSPTFHSEFKINNCIVYSFFFFSSYIFDFDIKDLSLAGKWYSRLNITRYFFFRVFFSRVYLVVWIYARKESILCRVLVEIGAGWSWLN